MANQNPLANPDFSDVTLQGTDGEKIQAHRILLAARSTFFRNLLLGDFNEARVPVVRLDFEGSILRAIVEYCYVDRVSLCGETCEPDLVETIVKIAVAADYFECRCDTLVTKWACEKINTSPRLAWNFLMAAETVAGCPHRIRNCA